MKNYNLSLSIITKILEDQLKQISDASKRELLYEYNSDKTKDLVMNKTVADVEFYVADTIASKLENLQTNLILKGE
jgi:hypothetical protein|tara:strand:- start:462 stop:689 length:228 start_codon:yes stop_codon:yes gene_type:complete